MWFKENFGSQVHCPLIWSSIAMCWQKDLTSFRRSNLNVNDFTLKNAKEGSYLKYTNHSDSKVFLGSFVGRWYWGLHIWSLNFLDFVRVSRLCKIFLTLQDFLDFTRFSWLVKKIQIPSDHCADVKLASCWVHEVRKYKITPRVTRWVSWVATSPLRCYKWLKGTSNFSGEEWHVTFTVTSGVMALSYQKFLKISQRVG